MKILPTHTLILKLNYQKREKLEYIYQCFQDSEKVHETDPHISTEHFDDTIYPQINNDIEYEYVHNDDNNILETRPQCTHTYDHISQQLNSLADTEQQHQVYTSEVDTSLFTSDTSTHCEFNIVPDSAKMETEKPIEEIPQNNTGIHNLQKCPYTVS